MFHTSIGLREILVVDKRGNMLAISAIAAISDGATAMDGCATHMMSATLTNAKREARMVTAHAARTEFDEEG